MTCHLTLSLLGKYLDKELTDSEYQQVSEHLEKCPDCRKEYQEMQNLKELIGRQKIADPGREYFTETTNLILAKTIHANGNGQSEVNPQDYQANRRKAFVRSLLSAAASLFILFSAITIGLSNDTSTSTLTQTDTPVYITAPLQDVLDSDSNQLATQKSQERLAIGVMLVGPRTFSGSVINPPTSTDSR